MVIIVRDFFGKLSYRLQGFMEGRYGSDELCQVLTYSGIFFMILSMFGLRFCYFISLILLLYSLFRSMSKNLGKRRKEREFFLQKTSGIRRMLSVLPKRWKDRNTHTYYACPGCKKYLRIRKPGKGKTIAIVCPHCGTSFQKKT